MRKLEDFTQTEVMGYLINKVSDEFDIPKVQAKKLLLNALLYNVVVAEILEQIQFLMEEDEIEEDGA